MNTQSQQFTFQRAKTTQGLTVETPVSTEPEKIEEPNQQTNTQNQSAQRKPLFQRQRTKTVSFGKGVMESPLNNVSEEETKSQSNDNLPTIQNNNINSNNNNNNSNNNDNLPRPPISFNSTPSSLRSSSSSKEPTIVPIPTNSNRITFAHKPMKLHSSQPQIQSSQSPSSQLNETNHSSLSQSLSSSQLTQSSRSHGNIGFGANFQNQNKPKIQPRVTIGTKMIANARSSASSLHATESNDENGKIVPSNQLAQPIAKKTHFSSSQLSLTTPSSPGLSSWVSPSSPQPKSQQFSYIHRKENEEQQYKNPEIYLRELELKIVQLRRIAQQQQVIIDNLRQKLHYNN